jgi:ACS family tartrate transporter-like MFS transporter
MDTHHKTIRKIRWRLLAPLLALLFLSTIDRANVSFAALQMNAALGLDARTYGFGVSVFFIGYILIQWPSLWLLQRIGMRRWVFTCAGIWGLAATGLAFVEDAKSFFALRLVLGIGEGGFAPGVMFYLARWIPARHRAGAISTFMLAVPLSAICGGPLAGWLMSTPNPLEWEGWRWMLLVEGIPALLLAVMALRWLCDSPEQAAWLSRDEREWIEAEISREAVPRQAHAPAAWRDPRLWIASACWFGLMAGANALLYWLPQILRHLSASSTELQIGLLAALPWMAVAAGMVINAWHSDRLQERHWHVGLAALASALFVAGAAWLGTGPAALLALLLAALAMGASQSTFWTLPPLFLPPSGLAPGFAVINMCGNLAGLVIPVFIGWMRQRTGSFDGPVFAIALLMLLAAGAVGLLRARSIAPPYSR